MPEFIMPIDNRDGQREFDKLDDFTRAYVEAMFFTECHADNPEMEDKTFEDLAPETLDQIKADCMAFQMAPAVAALISGGEDRAGRDFWFTRNGHGTGFWEPGRWSNLAGQVLDRLSKQLGGIYLYAGDDGLLYMGK